MLYYETLPKNYFTFIFMDTTTDTVFGGGKFHLYIGISTLEHKKLYIFRFFLAINKSLRVAHIKCGSKESHSFIDVASVKSNCLLFLHVIFGLRKQSPGVDDVTARTLTLVPSLKEQKRQWVVDWKVATLLA